MAALVRALAAVLVAATIDAAAAPNATAAGRALQAATLGVCVDPAFAGRATLAVGYWHTCALSTAGGVTCWGGNPLYGGQLVIPAASMSGGQVAVAAGGLHACTVSTTGGVNCWGHSDQVQIVPASAALGGQVAVAAGRYHTCALSVMGGVSCWGNGFAEQTTVPVSAAAGGQVAVAAGDVHTCALSNAGGVSCWGGNGDGQSTVPSSAAAGGQLAVATLAFHTCALSITGGVSCWGRNDYGQSSVPASVASGGHIVVAVGGYHTCALSTEGRVTCWGCNNHGQTNVPASAAAGDQVAVAAAHDHTCALSTTGAVSCWGSSDFGQTAVPAAVASGGVALPCRLAALVSPAPSATPSGTRAGSVSGTGTGSATGTQTPAATPTPTAISPPAPGAARIAVPAATACPSGFTYRHGECAAVFDYTGAYQFVRLPEYAASVRVLLWGAAGAEGFSSRFQHSCPRGEGFFIEGFLDTTFYNTTLRLIVGRGGMSISSPRDVDGCGRPGFTRSDGDDYTMTYGSGGGRSTIQTVSNGTFVDYVVAAGGGGGGDCWPQGSPGPHADFLAMSAMGSLCESGAQGGGGLPGAAGFSNYSNLNRVRVGVAFYISYASSSQYNGPTPLTRLPGSESPYFSGSARIVIVVPAYRAAPSVSAGSCNPSEYRLLPYQDLGGGSVLRVLTDIVTEGDCQITCCSVAGCNGYSYGLETAKCFLLQNATSYVPSHGYNSGVLWSAAPEGASPS